MPETKRPGFSLARHGRQWYVRFHDRGRLIQKPCGALALLEEAEAREAAGRIVAAHHAGVSRSAAGYQDPIKLYEKRLEDGNRNESYQANCDRYRDRLYELFGRDVDLRDLRRPDVERWRAWLLRQINRSKGQADRPLSPKSVREHISWLSAVCNHAGLANPCRGVELPRRSEAERQEALEYFTPDQLGTLFESCRVYCPYFYNALTFLTYTGCRVGEMSGLRNDVRDIDVANRIVWVTGKGARRRPLRLTGPVAPAWEAILAELAENPRPDGFIFPHFESWARKALQRLGRLLFGEDERGRPLRPCHPHMLRHTLASTALLHFTPAWDLPFLAKWLGHKDVGTTFRIYSHWLAPEAPSGYAAGMYNACTEKKAFRKSRKANVV
jgi:integrase